MASATDGRSKPGEASLSWQEAGVELLLASIRTWWAPMGGFSLVLSTVRGLAGDVSQLPIPASPLPRLGSHRTCTWPSNFWQSEVSWL